MSRTSTTTQPSERRLPTVPPYQRIEDQLRAKIQAGTWGIGVKLPSRKDLAQEYGVALATIERAVAALLSDGLLRADGARGTFISGHQKVSDRNDSPALNGHAPISNYREVLNSGKLSSTLGIIGTFCPSEQNGTDTANFWIRMVVGSLEQVFSVGGNATHFFNRYRPNQVPVPMREAIETLRNSGIDALALILVDDPVEIDEIADAVEADHLPVVFITSGEIRRPLTHVFYDNEDAGYLAAQHLIRRGHRELLFLAPFEAPWVQKRVLGAQEAVVQAGLPPSSLQVYPTERQRSPYLVNAQTWTHYDETLKQYHETAFTIARQVLCGNSTATGIIAADDYIALDLMRVAQEIGRSFGKELAIVGFDDNPQSRLVGLTSLRPPLEALGQEAARLLLLALHGEQTSLQVRLRSHVVPRLSTRPAANRAGRRLAPASQIIFSSLERNLPK